MQILNISLNTFIQHKHTHVILISVYVACTYTQKHRGDPGQAAQRDGCKSGHLAFSAHKVCFPLGEKPGREQVC